MLSSIVAKSRFTTRSLARYASTLVVSEPLGGNTSSLPPATLSAITAASKLHDGPIHVLVVDKDPIALASAPSNVTSVIVAQSDAPLLAEHVAAAIQAALSDDTTHIVTAATKYGANIAPRVAAQLNVSPITDVIEILDQQTFVRPTYAGNALAKVQAKEGTNPLLLSIRSTAFERAESVEGSVTMSPNEIKVDANPDIEWKSEAVSKSDRPDLSSASVVVSGGRGLQSGDNFVLLEALADKLHGAVGASRAAVDAGYVPNDLQVGQTGKVVAPDLYIAVGISGAIQHLSGMKDSKTIVAINKDEEAPIFTVADYGLKADLFEVVPELTSKV